MQEKFFASGSDMEALSDITALSQHQHRALPVQAGVRLRRKRHLPLPLHAKDIQIEFLSDIQLRNRLSQPFLRHFHLENAVILVDLNIVRDVVSRVTDGGPARKLTLRIEHLVCAVALQKLRVDIPGRPAHDKPCTQLLEQ